MKHLKILLGLALISVLPLSAQNRIQFAGMRNAIAYNYGGGQVAPPPLQVGAYVAAGTSVSITVSFGSVVAGDGTKFMPFSTNAKINIGVGTAIDSVTPSSVTCTTPDVYNTCIIVATTTYAHGIGDPISSATFGMQEALNIGAGVAVLDAAWATAGGTSTIMATATYPTGTALMDNRTGGIGGVVNTYVTLSNAQILAMSATPVAILPAMGAGTAWDVLDCFLENKNTGVAYASGGAIQLSYGAGVTNPATATVAATFLTSPTVAQDIKVAGALASTAASSINNTAVNITNASGAFTTGTGTMIVAVHARLVTGL